jgi:serine/threonine protein kinase
VVDFGLSNLYKPGEHLTTPCGSPCYAAPEMVSGLHYNGLKTDLWSTGIILYAMLCGCVPFEEPNTKKLYEKIKKSDFVRPKYLLHSFNSLLATFPLPPSTSLRNSLQRTQRKESQWRVRETILST